jgi:hypothetical protein
MKIKSSTIDICCSTNKHVRREAFDDFMKRAKTFQNKVLVKRMGSWIDCTHHTDKYLTVIAIGKKQIMFNRYEFINDNNKNTNNI